MLVNKHGKNDLYTADPTYGNQRGQRCNDVGVRCRHKTGWIANRSL